MFKKEDDRSIQFCVTSEGAMEVTCTADYGDGHKAALLYLLDKRDVAQLINEIQANASKTEEHDELPDEPEERGVYVAQTGELLTKDSDDEWSYKDTPYDKNGRWNNCCDLCDDIHTYTQDWGAVVDTIGKEAFPLKRLSENDVIAFAKHDDSLDNDDLEEPEASGVYKTQTGKLLGKTDAFGWIILPEDPDAPLYKWQPEDKSMWTKDWCDVLFTLGEEEFPLEMIDKDAKSLKH